jgi:hypothetical protein
MASIGVTPEQPLRLFVSWSGIVEVLRTKMVNAIAGNLIRGVQPVRESRDSDRSL